MTVEDLARIAHDTEHHARVLLGLRRTLAWRHVSEGERREDMARVQAVLAGGAAMTYHEDRTPRTWTSTLFWAVVLAHREDLEK
jgi:hypothetical protein